MKRREPKKGEGVPKDTRERHLLNDLSRAIDQARLGVRGKDAVTRLIRQGYFEQSLMEQMNGAARWLATIASTPSAVDRLLDALAKSNHEKVNGLGPKLIDVTYPTDPAKALPWIERFGRIPNHWSRESAQMALRRQIIEQGARPILDRTRRWLSDADENARRLMAEGFRPRGVWTRHLDELRKDPSLLSEILDPLIDDPSLYVRKAVANNLNDLSKDHPEVVCRWLGGWLAQPTVERRWIAQRALRTLAKQGHAGAASLLGMGDASLFEVRWAGSLPRQVRVNDIVRFEIDVDHAGQRPALARVDVLFIEPAVGKREKFSRYLLGKARFDAKGRCRLSKGIHVVHRNQRARPLGRYRLRLVVNGVPQLGADRTLTLCE